jgi:hypothetical protein
VFLDNAKKEGVRVQLTRGLIEEKYKVQSKTTKTSGTSAIPLVGLPDASWASMSKTGEKRQMLGETAYKYQFEHSGTDSSDPVAWFVSLAPQLGGLAELGRFTVRREACVVPTSPGVDEFQKFYRGEAGTLKGPLSFPIANGITALTELGLPFKLTEETSIWFAPPSAYSAVGFNTKATTTLTSVSAIDIGDGMFFETVPAGYAGASATEGAAPPSLPEAGACDCSCTAFKEFQALGKRQKDPKAKAEMREKAACGAPCMTRWFSCALQH